MLESLAFMIYNSLFSVDFVLLFIENREDRIHLNYDDERRKK